MPTTSVGMAPETESRPMRRYSREQHTARMFRGGELPRLMSGILMLGILYMLYGWMREANTWRWLAKDDGKASPNAKDIGPPPTPVVVPAPTGPTDEDPDQAEEARQEFQVISDGSLTLQREEMEPYDRLVFWVNNQSFATLRKRARADLLFTHFHDEADKYRGQIVSLEMNVRRIIDAGKNRDGVQLYEVWGFTPESGDRLYVAIVVDLPKGMPIGPSVHEKAKFVGYFLKLQGYHSVGAKAGAVPDKAPLLVGRLKWEPVVAPPIDNTREWIWGLGILAVIGFVLLIRFVYIKWFRGNPVPRSMISDTATGEVIPIETWLEQSNFGTNDEEDNDENGNPRS